MSKPHKWQIFLNAGSYYMCLANHFPGGDIGLGYEHDENGQQFFAYSHHIDELDDINAVGRRLYSLELILNGALMLQWNNSDFYRIYFNGFSACGAGASHSIYAETIEEVPFIDTQALRVGAPEWDDPKNTFATHLISIAKTDKNIRSLLFLFGLTSNNSPLECILTWGTLYKILDCIQHYGKSIGKTAEDYASKKDIKSFTAACNNMSVLGLYARHGAANNPPPSNAMTDLSEAQKIILSVGSKFCRDYLASKYP